MMKEEEQPPPRKVIREIIKAFKFQRPVRFYNTEYLFGQEQAFGIDASYYPKTNRVGMVIHFSRDALTSHIVRITAYSRLYDMEPLLLFAVGNDGSSHCRTSSEKDFLEVLSMLCNPFFKGWGERLVQEYLPDYYRQKFRKANITEFDEAYNNLSKEKEPAKDILAFFTGYAKIAACNAMHKEKLKGLVVMERLRGYFTHEIRLLGLRVDADKLFYILSEAIGEEPDVNVYLRISECIEGWTNHKLYIADGRFRFSEPEAT